MWDNPIIENKVKMEIINEVSPVFKKFYNVECDPSNVLISENTVSIMLSISGTNVKLSMRALNEAIEGVRKVLRKYNLDVDDVTITAELDEESPICDPRVYMVVDMFLKKINNTDKLKAFLKTLIDVYMKYKGTKSGYIGLDLVKRETIQRMNITEDEFHNLLNKVCEKYLGLINISSSRGVYSLYVRINDLLKVVSR